MDKLILLLSLPWTVLSYNCGPSEKLTKLESNFYSWPCTFKTVTEAKMTSVGVRGNGNVKSKCALACLYRPGLECLYYYIDNDTCKHCVTNFAVVEPVAVSYAFAVHYRENVAGGEYVPGRCVQGPFGTSGGGGPFLATPGDSADDISVIEVCQQGGWFFGLALKSIRYGSNTLTGPITQVPQYLVNCKTISLAANEKITGVDVYAFGPTHGVQGLADIAFHTTVQTYGRYYQATFNTDLLLYSSTGQNARSFYGRRGFILDVLGVIYEDC